MSLQAHVDRYVAVKRHLGYKFVNNERILRSWAAWAVTRGDDFIVADAMLGWACDASSSAAAAKRLSVGRRFAVWLQAEEPRHEVPAKNALGPATRRRPIPHLLTNAEIGRLMAAALSLPPKGSITPHTWHCIIGLMATTGLRRCEACALRLTDITADGLVVRETKFGSRGSFRFIAAPSMLSTDTSPSDDAAARRVSTCSFSRPAGRSIPIS